ncbi:hypothetical protein [Hyphococcus luteus]|uniref:hypothetical protein n=1 Tax=Hyphococcus luteus TaxID=2058213 RepID=UPI001056FC41|nr:hypothetical protein [Marinicaulis flavus]
MRAFQLHNLDSICGGGAVNVGVWVVRVHDFRDFTEVLCAHLLRGPSLHAADKFWRLFDDRISFQPVGLSGQDEVSIAI